MSLVSTVPAEAAAAAAASDFLLDTGWVGVTGTGADVDLVSVTPTEDAQLFIYVKFYKNQTSLANFKLNIPKYTHDTGGAEIGYAARMAWRTPQSRGYQQLTSDTLVVMDMVEAYNDSWPASVNQSSEANNQSCFFVEKGVLCKFQASSAFTSSYGIMYRMILKKSTSQNMVDMSQNR